MGLIGGWKTALGAIAAIILGLGTCLVAVGTAGTQLVTDPTSFDWVMLTASLKTGAALVIAGITALGIGHKLQKVAASNEAMLEIEEDGYESVVLDVDRRVAALEAKIKAEKTA